jgi:hypothetical protein
MRQMRHFFLNGLAFLALSLSPVELGGCRRFTASVFRPSPVSFCGVDPVRNLSEVYRWHYLIFLTKSLTSPSEMD